MKPLVQNPWDRRPDETSKAYAAFCAYLELGPERSIERAFRDRNGTERAQKTQGAWWRRWSSRHDWVERARAFDDHEWNQRLEARQTAIEQSRQLLVDGAMDAARSLLDIAIGKAEGKPQQVTALRALLDRIGLVEVKESRITGTDGGAIEITPARSTEVLLDIEGMPPELLRQILDWLPEDEDE